MIYFDVKSLGFVCRFGFLFFCFVGFVVVLRCLFEFDCVDDYKVVCVFIVDGYCVG